MAQADKVKVLNRDEFDLLIGQLDRILSKMVRQSTMAYGVFDVYDIQTLKHHAEDMILAGRKCLKELGISEEKIDAVR